MKGLKKFLFFFLILFAFGFSNENKDSKVVLDKVRETSQLKIGVTKIKSKELPMEFDVESKKVYGEIEITDNDLVFVSETLDEIPSVSTTNGRRVINNINKYLTKNIKESPKFNYQIVDGKTESGEKNGKKYLVIDCKEQLPSVYVYVLEKGSYKIKNVYKGAFKQLYAVTRDIEYGTFEFTSDHRMDTVQTLVHYSNGKILLNGRESSVVSFIGASFPKRLTQKPNTEIGRLQESYRIIVENGNGSINKGEVRELEGKNETCINNSVNLRNSKNESIGKIRLKTTDDDEYMTMEIGIKDPFNEIKNKIIIEYGCSNIFGDNFKVQSKEIININIAKKVSNNFPKNTEGEIFFEHGEQIALNGGSGITIRTTDGENINVIPPMTLGNKTSYKVTGKFPKKINFEDPSLDFDNGERILRIEVSYREKLEPTIEEINFGKRGETNANSISCKFENISMKDTYGLEVGKMSIDGETNSDYYEIKLSDWKTIHSSVRDRVSFIYISKKDGKETILKEDKYIINIKPLEENIPKNTKGTLLITSIENLEFKDFYLDLNGELKSEKNRHEVVTDDFDMKNATYSGMLPKIIQSNLDSNKPYNGSWVNWGKSARVVINSTDGWSHEMGYDYRDGGFNTGSGNDGWEKLKNTAGDLVGWVHLQCIGSDLNKKSTITIGLEPEHTSSGFYNFDLKGGSVNTRYEIIYQADVTGKGDWVTKKKDVFNLIIQDNSNLNNNTGKIELRNPLVYYDKSTSSAISNIVHDKRVHIAENEVRTLKSNGNLFNKNTDLMGKNWVDIIEPVEPYNWLVGKHKVIISQGTNLEVRKETDENGRTASATFISGKDTVNGEKNQVMFSYDGGHKYMNLGLSSYNFKGGDINGVEITHYGEGNNLIESREIIDIKIERFDGLCYVNPSYNIKPDRDYIRTYSFDQEAGIGKEIIIDYGTVGFRDLDTRITNKNGGKGIELRCVKDVVIKNVEKPEYFMLGQLYFEGIGVESYKDDKGRDVTSFKGENEKETYKMLKLKINNQELLVPKEKFIILTKDGKCPLQVGVQVNSDKGTYFTSVCGKEADSIAPNDKIPQKGLFLEMESKRFIETEIIFENPNLSVIDENGNATGKNYIDWIALNESKYPGGFLKKNIGNSNFWGKVRKEVIDIPIRLSENKEDQLKIQMFEYIDKDNPDHKETLIADDIVVSPQGDMDTGSIVQERAKIHLSKFRGGEAGGKDSNFVIRHQRGTDFLEFSLDNGYDSQKDSKKEKEFYLRYLDKHTNKFLFDQKITVKIRGNLNYLGNSSIIFKNPTMTGQKGKEDGFIRLSETGVDLGESNNTTAYDNIKWFTVGGPIEYPINSETPEFKLLKTDNLTIEYPKEFVGFKNNNGKYFLKLALPDERATFEKCFGNYSGEKIETSYDLSFDGNESVRYRINFVIDEFNPRYFGKIYPQDVSQGKGENWREINEVGVGKVHLGHKPELDANGNVIIDLGTNYRDYLRYPSLIEQYLGKKLEVGIVNDLEVDIISKDNINTTRSIIMKGKVRFEDENKKLFSSKTVESIGNGLLKNELPKSYKLKLILTQSEYKKLKPNEIYELSLKGNQNILNIGILGNSKLSKEILLNNPLSFITEGPTIKITPEILNFGAIKLKAENGETIKKEVTKSANILVEIDENSLSPDFKTNLAAETEEIWIYKKTESGQKVENAQPLKVKGIKVEKGTVKEVKNIKSENYNITGTLEVPLKENVQYGEYTGIVTVTFIYE